MNAITTQNVADLKESLAGAQARHRELVAESRSLPEELRKASKQAARQKADAARNGDELQAVSADLDAQELRDREATISFDLWAQQITVQEIAADLLRAQLEEAEAEMLKTGPAYEKAQRDLALAEKAHGDAYAAHSGAGNRAQGLRLKLRDSHKAISALENDSPGG